MNIDAIQAALMQGNSLPQPSDVQQVAKFTQLMQQVEPAPPMMSPDQLLDAQSEWMRGTLSVDLTAKVAGTVEQSINKLVNMQ